MVPKRTRPVATWSASVRWGALSTRDAMWPEKTRSPSVISVPGIRAMTAASVKQRPAFAGSIVRNCATNLVVARPSPAPATMPNRPCVLWIMPTSPKPIVPRSRPANTDDASVRPRDTTAPTSAQNAPTAKCRATEWPGTADTTSPLLATAFTPGHPVVVAAVPRDQSGQSSQQALDRLTHGVQLVQRHVRIERKRQRLPAGHDRALHTITAAARDPLKQRLLVQRGVEVSLRLDALPFQFGADVVAAHAGALADEQNEVVPGAHAVFGRCLRAAAGKLTEPCGVALDQHPTRLDQLVEALQGQEAHRRMHLAHAGGEAEIDHVLAIGRILAVIAHRSESRRQAWIAGADHPAFDRGDDLGRTQREHLARPEGAGFPAAVFRPETLGAVEVHGKSMASPDLEQRV